MNKFLLWLNILLIILMIIIPWLYYPKLPLSVPSHWNLKGEIDRYSTKLSYIIIISLFTPMTNIILLIIYAVRWPLIQKYPYAISLPAMVMILGSERIPEHVKRKLIEKMFDIVLLIGLLVGVYMFGLEILMLESALSGKINSILLMIFTIVGTIGLIVITLMAYRQYYIKEIKPIKERNRAFNSA